MYREDIANLDRQIEELCARKAELEEAGKKRAEKTDELNAIKKAIDEYNAKYDGTLALFYNHRNIWTVVFPL